MADDPWMQDGGPAFPVRSDEDDDATTYKGMSLRDWFAGMVLRECLAWVRSDGRKDGGLSPPERVARIAYETADAMLAARKKGGAA
jgi:hypothetical protein